MNGRCLHSIHNLRNLSAIGFMEFTMYATEWDVLYLILETNVSSLFWSLLLSLIGIASLCNELETSAAFSDFLATLLQFCNCNLFKKNWMCFRWIISQLCLPEFWKIPPDKRKVQGSTPSISICFYVEVLLCFFYS